MVSKDLLLRFPRLTGLVLDKNIPYHRPIVLFENCMDYGPSHFRLFDSWFELKGFDEVVRNSWNSTVVGNMIDNLSVIFNKKLQLFKSNLRLWNSSAWDRLISKRKTFQENVELIDASLMHDGGSADLREQRVSTIKELTNLDHLSRAGLAQKVKVQWAIEGDENSGFFHGIINWKRR